MGDLRLRHHPRRSTFTAATQRCRLASTALAHAAAIPLAASEFGFIVRYTSSTRLPDTTNCESYLALNSLGAAGEMLARLSPAGRAL